MIFKETSLYLCIRGRTNIASGHNWAAFAQTIAECTPKRRASYEQAATTPLLWGLPPTIRGLPLNSGLSFCSTDAKKASISI